MGHLLAQQLVAAGSGCWTCRPSWPHGSGCRPRMVRIVSPDYPTSNSSLAEILRDELGFMLDLPPDAAARDAANRSQPSSTDSGQLP